MATTQYRIAVGGYTDVLTVLAFHADEKKLVPASSLASANASWLVPHPTAPNVWFTTSEVDPGFVRVLEFNGLEGGVIGEFATGGIHPTHIAITPDGTELFVANYSSGDVSVLPVLPHAPYLASQASAAGLIAFPYASPAPDEPQTEFNPGRQESSHPHQVLPLPAPYNEVLVPDLGSDKIWRLAKDSEGRWAIAEFIAFPRGSGPRHALLLDGVLYTVCELSCKLVAHALPPLPAPASFEGSIPTLPEPAGGVRKKTVLLPSELAYTSSLPPTPAPEDASTDLVQPVEPQDVSEPPPPKLAAEILAPPALPEDNGARFIYVSNRNETSSDGDSIAVYTPLPDFKLIRRIPTGVQHLRGLNFSPDDARYLALAGQNGGGVKIFERRPGGNLVEVPNASIADGEGGVVKTTSVTWL